MPPTTISRRQFQAGWRPSRCWAPGPAAPLPHCRCSTPISATATTPGRWCRRSRRWPSCARRGCAVRRCPRPTTRGTQMPVAEAPDLIVPALRRYCSRREIGRRMTHDSVGRYLEARPNRFKYAGLGEVHLYGADADLAVVRLMVALARTAPAAAARAFRRRLHRAPAAPVARGAGAVGALGLRPARARARGPAPPRAAVVRPGLPRRPRHAGPGRSGLARGLHRVSRSFHGRHRHLHARALALHRRTCPCFSRLAGRPRAGLQVPTGLRCHPQANADPETTRVQTAEPTGTFVGSLQSGPTPFDLFRGALARGDARRAARYPLPAKRGLRLFIGRGQCSTCHVGGNFSNGEFADIGAAFFVRPGWSIRSPWRHHRVARHPLPTVGPPQRCACRRCGAEDPARRPATPQLRGVQGAVVAQRGRHRAVPARWPVGHAGGRGEPLVEAEPRPPACRRRADPPAPSVRRGRAALVAFPRSLSDPRANRWQRLASDATPAGGCGKV